MQIHIHFGLASLIPNGINVNYHLFPTGGRHTFAPLDGPTCSEVAQFFIIPQEKPLLCPGPQNTHSTDLSRAAPAPHLLVLKRWWAVGAHRWRETGLVHLLGCSSHCLPVCIPMCQSCLWLPGKKQALLWNVPWHVLGVGSQRMRSCRKRESSLSYREGDWPGAMAADPPGWWCVLVPQPVWNPP